MGGPATGAAGGWQLRRGARDADAVLRTGMQRFWVGVLLYCYFDC